MMKGSNLDEELRSKTSESENEDLKENVKQASECIQKLRN